MDKLKRLFIDKVQLLKQIHYKTLIWKQLAYKKVVFMIVIIVWARFHKLNSKIFTHLEIYKNIQCTTTQIFKKATQKTAI